MAGHSILSAMVSRLCRSARKASRSLRICQAAVDAGSGVECDVQFALLAIEIHEIGFRPFFEFADKFDGGITRFGDFFEALIEWQVAIDGPKHYGEWEWRC